MRIWCFLLASAFLPQAALSKSVQVRHQLELETKLAVGLEDDESHQALLIVRPSAQVKLSPRWSLDVTLRLEAAGADTGLGTRETFSEISRPLKISEDARMEIDEAVLGWRRGGARIRLGKQTAAWGVLDGVQVTDRFDAVRRREAVFFDNRPDRISRWGARAEFSAAGVRWDAAAFFDGTGDQLAERGDAFEVTASRLRAGLPAGAGPQTLSVDISNEPTFGLRATRTFGADDVSLLVFNGPETEPVFTPDGAGVELDYRTRTLLGATWRRSAGPRVFRMEAAWIPSQPVNLSAPTLGVDRRNRVLAGAGLDWDLPEDFFANLQLAMDWVEGDDLVRPNTDVIATLRVQKTWANDTWRAGAEVIASLGDGDGVFRPGVAWQATDTLRLESGVDAVFGPSNGLIGQFSDRDRAWFRARVSI